MGRFTGRAILGVQGASSYRAGLNPFEVYSYGGRSTFTVPDYFTDIVSATFYPIDDLALSVGHIYSFGRNAVTGEVEYLLPQFRGGNIAPSAFVSAAYGWNNSSNIMAGIRIYFGNHDKTLIRRQREDDPVAHIPHQPHQPVGVGCAKNSGTGSPTEPCGWWVQQVKNGTACDQPASSYELPCMWKWDH
jgi:hypothetical protein